MVNIKNSKLTNSPIIVNSPKSKIDNSRNAKTKRYTERKGFFNVPWVRYILIPLTVAIVAGITIFYLTGGRKMPKSNNKTKVNIQDSNLDRSPVIVDSHGASVDNSINVNPKPEEFQKLSLSEEKNVKQNDGSWKKTMVFGSQYGVALKNIKLTLKFDSEFDNVKSYIRGSGFVMREESSSNFSKNKTEYYHTESILNNNNYLVIEVASKNALKLIQ